MAATAEKTRRVIGLWLDTASGEEPAWIVSRDEMDAQGRAVTTDTVHVFAQDEYERARETAVRLGGMNGWPVVETGEDGGQEDIWAPAASRPAYTVHLVLSELPTHVPTQLPFYSAAQARDLCRAAIASPAVLRAYVANADGVPLAGQDYRKKKGAAHAS